MAWQQVSYWAIRCDGKTTHGQCEALLHSQVDPIVGIKPDGTWKVIPALFTAKAVLAAPSVRDEGWMLLPDKRILCPDHIRAGEKLAEAEMSGLPFEFEEA